MCSGLPLALPSSYMGELPNSHGRTLTDKSYVMHGILSGTGGVKNRKLESTITKTYAREGVRYRGGEELKTGINNYKDLRR